MRSNLETFIQQLLESVGHSLSGRATLSEIKQSQKDLSIVTTLIGLCVRNLDMVVTMVDNPQPSPCKPTYLSQLLLDSSQSTLEHSRRTLDGTLLWMANSELWETLLHLQDESAGFSGAVTIQAPYGKRLLMTLKEA